METLISKAYADKRRTLMSETHALQWDAVPSYGTLNGDTVYIGSSTMLAMLFIIHSLYGVFGSAVADGTGIVLKTVARTSRWTLNTPIGRKQASGLGIR